LPTGIEKRAGSMTPGTGGMRMNKLAAIVTVAVALATPVAAGAFADMFTRPGEMTIHEIKNYSGERYVVRKADIEINLRWDTGSVSIHPGDVWELCAKPLFKECVTATESIKDAVAIGIVGQIRSARLKKK
jgi:hypothetical protein